MYFWWLRSISSEMLRTPPQTYVRSSCRMGYIGFTCCILWVDLTLSWGLYKLRRRVKGAVLHWWIRGNRILMLSQYFLLVTWPFGTMIYFSPLWGGYDWWRLFIKYRQNMCRKLYKPKGCHSGIYHKMNICIIPTHVKKQNMIWFPNPAPAQLSPPIALSKSNHYFEIYIIFFLPPYTTSVCIS